MELRRYTSADTFAEATEAFLLRNEAHNHLLLGILSELRQRPRGVQRAYMALIEQAGLGPVAVALRTPPWNVLLSWPFAEPAVGLVVDDLLAGEAGAGGRPPGVLAGSGIAARFAEAWQQRTGEQPRLRIAQRIYQLEAVRPVGGVPGRLIRADDRHRSLIREWLAGFDRDAGSVSPASDDERVEGFLHGPGREMYLWQDQGPVSMAACAGPTPNGMRISAVYTPPDKRRRGYASACVAALSQRVLDSGRHFCFLFTDLANPTSNHIYQRLGYEPVGDVDLYTWLPDR